MYLADIKTSDQKETQNHDKTHAKDRKVKI